MTIKRIGTARPWEPDGALLAVAAGLFCGDAERVRGLLAAWEATEDAEAQADGVAPFGPGAHNRRHRRFDEPCLPPLPRTPLQVAISAALAADPTQPDPVIARAAGASATYVRKWRRLEAEAGARP